MFHGICSLPQATSLSKTTGLCVALAAAFFLSACSGSGGSGGSDGDRNGQDKTAGLSDPELKELLNNDLDKLRSFDATGISTHRDRPKNVDFFDEIYGGKTGADLTNYINQRLHYYFTTTEKNNATLEPSGFPAHTAWEKDDQIAKLGQLGAVLMPEVPNLTNSQQDDGRAVVGAANIGTAIWFLGILDRVTPVITIAGQTVSVDSSRVGLMEIGPGYLKSIVTDKDEVIEIPAEYRQAILLHEARHSDCTNGVSQSQLDAARVAKSSTEFYANYKALSCGHLHILCPAGHAFAGLPACDSEPWGAYAVQAIFQIAASKVLTGIDQRILEIQAMDSLDRVQVDHDKLLRGDLGSPDMTSGEVRN
jgi:hypothetical protein